MKAGLFGEIPGDPRGNSVYRLLKGAPWLDNYRLFRKVVYKLDTGALFTARNFIDTGVPVERQI